MIAMYCVFVALVPILAKRNEYNYFAVNCDCDGTEYLLLGPIKHFYIERKVSNQLIGWYSIIINFNINVSVSDWNCFHCGIKLNCSISVLIYSDIPVMNNGVYRRTVSYFVVNVGKVCNLLIIDDKLLKISEIIKDRLIYQTM